MELRVTTAFPTVIGQLHVPDAGAMNEVLREVILAEESMCESLGQSNIGGWHSRTDFLNHSEPMIAILITWITWGVSRMVDATAGAGVFKGSVSLSAWATVCRSGTYHAPHSRPDSAWSGVYYVDAGTDCDENPLSGVLEFLDPRAGAAAVTAPGDPYGELVRIRPEDSLLVVFPSWLFHWVHPYAGRTPRITVSFNAAVDRQCSIEKPAKVYRAEGIKTNGNSGNNRNYR